MTENGNGSIRLITFFYFIEAEVAEVVKQEEISLTERGAELDAFWRDLESKMDSQLVTGNFRDLIASDYKIEDNSLPENLLDKSQRVN